MTKKRTEVRGPAFATGGLRRPREDLVAWPADSKGPVFDDSAPASTAAEDDGDDVHADLARAKREIRRLLGRVQELSEENQRLRRELGARSPR